MSMDVTEWVKAGEPTGVPFRFRRDFDIENLERHAGHVKEYIESFMVASANLYADGPDFRFLPIVNEEEWALIPHIYVMQSDKGEIMVTSECRPEPWGTMVFWAGVIMEVSG